MKEGKIQEMGRQRENVLLLSRWRSQAGAEKKAIH